MVIATSASIMALLGLFGQRLTGYEYWDTHNILNLIAWWCSIAILATAMHFVLKDQE
jgi:ABC-type xylose transport system permease subunit